MRARCNNLKHKQYGDYGGRGIRVCGRWDKFENFLADMGEAPQGLTLDRRENDGNYEPDNCRWSPPVVQANNRRGNLLVTINTQTKTAAEWAREFGISRRAMCNRIHKGKYHVSCQ